MRITERQLHAKRKVVFDSMVRLVASSLQIDLGDAPARSQVEDEVEKMSENWAITEPVEGHSPNTELQRLLAEYHELGEQILDIRDATDRHG